MPVLLFLAALELIDTYKLLSLRRVLRSVGVGCAAAVICYVLNTAVYQLLRIPPDVWARSGAPVVEEIAKMLYVGWLIRSSRLGFMVDAAISGFAVGAGFAVLENLTYIPDVSAAGVMTSAIRGLGTAMMHGGTTAIFGIVSSNLAEIRGTHRWSIFIPGLAIGIAIHELYNQPWHSPVISAVAILLLIPTLLSYTFWRSEKALEKWVGTKLDKDIDLLQMMTTGKFSDTRAGAYLRSLENSFSSEVLGDMLCYLQLSLELSARAKGDLLRREMGFEVTSDSDLKGQFKELAFLESNIGRAGKLALSPLLGSTRRDVWELQQLAAGPDF